MIRLFTLFCKLNQISFSDRQWVERESADFCASSHACPVCGTKGSLYRFAHYERYLVQLQENQPVTCSLSISRYRCASCGHTHAIHSSSLVPYRSYSLRFILHVLQDYFLHRSTVLQLCTRYGISVSTLYSWKTLFLKQKALWLGVLEDLVQEAGMFLREMDGRLLRDFHNTFCFSLLSRIFVTDRAVPFFHPSQENAIT